MAKANKTTTKKPVTPESKRPSVIVYLRLPRAMHDKLAKRASKRGWPHTIASVASEAMGRGMR